MTQALLTEDLLKSKWASYLSLFASTGTLFCCALPSLFVVLGMGSTLAGFVGAVPQIIWFSEYKALVFSVSGIMILIAGSLQYRARFEPCPVDPQLAKACSSARQWSQAIFIISAMLWLTGAFFAFIAPLVL